MHPRGNLLAGCAALALPVATILLVVWPNIRGSHGTGTETVFDASDPLFGDARVPPPRPADDSSPVAVDWPRDRHLLERVHGGHFDLWNPIVGNGVPLAPDTAGIFNPLRVVLYAAPVAPYTAFVLFRIAKLLVAALGAYLLARAHAMSRPASAVVSITFGLSGGMISQMPFATVESVCWLPWICWAQLRTAQRPVVVAVVPHALTVAAVLTGGHQPIVAAMMMGALMHAFGILAVQPTWLARGRVAAFTAAGYAVGLMIAGPTVLATIELLANGHSYKSTDMSHMYQVIAMQTNRAALFVGAIVPQGIDSLRDGLGNADYPYIINFACGTLAYLLMAVALVWRRWRLEWVPVFVLGIGFCFGPPGFGWMRTAPLVQDILPRYTWALFVLPITVMAGLGVDALFAAAEYKRGPLFARVGTLPSRLRFPRDAVLTTLVAAIGLFVSLALLAAVVMLLKNPRVAAPAVALFDEKLGFRPNPLVPLTILVATMAAAAILSRLRVKGGRWFLTVAACIELAAIAVPHLRDAPSRAIREPDFGDTAQLAADIASEHTRIGGRTGVTVGWRGWREGRLVAPLAPLRYARFLAIAAGPIAFTAFELPAARSALADLASIGYVIVPRTDDVHLDGDAQYERVASIKGVTIFRNRGVLPRARVVHRTIVEVSADNASARLSAMTAGDPHVATTALAAAAILESVPGAVLPLELDGGVPTPAEFIVDDADRVSLNVDSPEPGYLILADTHYPGWTATVDGQDRTIYPANVGFRAVYVESGKHTITFVFRPRTFRAGLMCAVAALLACAAIVLQGRTKKTA